MTTLLNCVLILLSFICFCFMTAIAHKRGRRIKKLSEDLHAEIELSNYYRHVIDGFCEKMKEEEEKYALIQADYYTSESDSLKYSSDEKMYRAIKSKMAMLIGNDIAKKFEPSILPLGEGKQKYRLVLKVKKI